MSQHDLALGSDHPSLALPLLYILLHSPPSAPALADHSPARQEATQGPAYLIRGTAADGGADGGKLQLCSSCGLLQGGVGFPRDSGSLCHRQLGAGGMERSVAGGVQGEGRLRRQDHVRSHNTE